MAERIGNEVISQCHQCGAPADTHVNCKNINCNLLFIQCDDCQEMHEKCCSSDCLEVSKLTLEEQKKLRKNKENKERFHSHRKVDLSKAFDD